MKKKVIFIAGLIIPILLVFIQTTEFHYLKSWDDGWQVLNRFTTNGLTFDNIKEIFSTFYCGQYSPLNQLTYTITYIITGLNPKGYHLNNLIFHISYVCMVFIFVNKLLHMYTQTENSRNNWISFIVTLFIAIHPVQVEVIAWISASKVLIYSNFFIGALICYLKYLQTYKSRYYIGTILLFICSFLCKEQAIILPCCLLLIDWFVFRKITDSIVLIEKIPFFALSCCFLMITVYSYDKTFEEVVAPNLFYTLPQRIAFMGYSLSEYLQKILLPINLMYLYPYPMAAGDSLPTRFWIYPLILPIIVFILWHFRKERVFIFGSIFFLIQISFFLHIIPLPRFAITADRYLYMALLGFFISAIWYIYSWFEQRNKKIILYILLFLCLTGEGICSYQYCKKWDNDRILKLRMNELLNNRTTKIQPYY